MNTDCFALVSIPPVPAVYNSSVQVHCPLIAPNHLQADGPVRFIAHSPRVRVGGGRVRAIGAVDVVGECSSASDTRTALVAAGAVGHHHSIRIPLCTFSDEMSRHRTRPPTFGLQRLTRVNVVDNSKLAREALLHHRLPYVINVYKPGAWLKHTMPRAQLGDKVTVVVKGQVCRALVVGYYPHESERRHGVAGTDVNSVVLLDKDGNPLGTRILAPVPHALRHMRHDPTVAKVLAIAKNFV